MIRRTLGRSATVVLAVGSALALAVAPAFATVTVSSSGGNSVTISTTGSDSVALTCQSNQVAVNATPVSPPVACTALVSLVVTAGGGGNTISWSGVNATTFPALIDVREFANSGGAPDVVNGTQVRDVVKADTGDTVVAGGGNDYIAAGTTIDAGDGDDVVLNGGTVLGGGGNDRIANPQSADGGDGYDIITYDFSEFGGPGSLVVVIGPGSLTIGSPPIATLTSAQFEQWDLILPPSFGFPDAVDSRTFPGRLVLTASEGPDTIQSGAGSDVIYGGRGADAIDPGAGSDDVSAGEGNDSVSVRDGVADIVDCGGGADTATADRVDVLSNCENVSVPAPDTGKVAGPKRVTKGEKATFTFGSSTADATFECQLDKGAFKACSSPFKVKTKKLKTGKHTLTVRAVQPSGNADPTPSAFKFKVVAKK
jgi:Ca2+-binding RTX toxin-like protein